jgi:hypothetical protein
VLALHSSLDVFCSFLLFKWANPPLPVEGRGFEFAVVAGGKSSPPQLFAYELQTGPPSALGDPFGRHALLADAPDGLDKGLTQMANPLIHLIKLRN